MKILLASSSGKSESKRSSDFRLRNEESWFIRSVMFLFHLELWEIWQRLRETQSVALPVWTEASQVIAMKKDQIIIKNREGDQCKKLQGKKILIINCIFYIFIYTVYAPIWQYTITCNMDIYFKRNQAHSCSSSVYVMFTIQLQISCCVLFLK